MCIPCDNSAAQREALFRTAVREFGPVLDRLVNGYEADADKRHDLRQEIHFRLWRSLEGFDGRCSLKTWTLRVAHNTAVSHVTREKRWRSRFLSIEELERKADQSYNESNAGALDRKRALDQAAVPANR
jgi:RNA polymerase sigma-70 factor, ECF subfamily